MSHRTFIAASLAVALWSGCATTGTSSSAGTEAAAVAGVIRQIGNHGNAYTDVPSSAYAEIGLRAGAWVRLSLPDTTFAARLGADYAAVPSGEPVVVLHREGLTFAVRDAEFATRFAVAAGDSFRVFLGAAAAK